MYRKVLITILMLGVGMVGFSKTEEIKNVNPKELAKTVVETSHKELLDNMKLRLKDSKIKVSLGKHMTEQQQFLYQENLIDSVLKAKSHLLKDVWGKLCDESNMPTELIYEGIDINKIDYKKIETGKDQGMIDSTALIVPVSFQAHTIAKDNVSDVKYKITFKWEVKVVAETEKTSVDGKKKKVIVGYTAKKGKPALISSVAHPIQFLTSEKWAMKKAAQNAIIEWYANLSQTLDKQYAEQAVTAVKAINVSANDIKMSLPEGQTFTVADVKDIAVNIDPYQFISNDDMPLYTNPEACIIITPTFHVSVDDSFKNAKISVSYVVKETVKPIADKEKELRRSAANSAITELSGLLSAYVASRDAEQKAALENMFDTAESDVEVSHLPKQGPEKIKKESAQKYLSLLKGTSLNLVAGNPEVVNPNWDSLIYTVDQKYQSKTYSDYTQKRIYLTYNPEKGTYLISKIEVVPNSTKVE